MFVNPQNDVSKFLLGEGMKVVDFGSGAGHFTIPAAAKVGKYGEVIAVDIQSDLLSKLLADAKSQGHHHVRVIHADLDAADVPKSRSSKKGAKKSVASTAGSKKSVLVGLKSGYADRVLLINTLFQIQEKISVLEEAKRLLKEGGALVLVDWHPKKGSPWPDAHLMTPAEARTVLHKAGFEEVLEIDLPHHHYGFIARKIKEGGKSRMKSSLRKVKEIHH